MSSARTGDARDARRRVVSVGVVVFFIVGSWLAGQGMVSHLTVDMIFAIFLGLIVFGLLRTINASVMAARIVACSTTLAGWIGLEVWSELRLTPYAMIAVINLGVGTIFIRGQRAASEPVLLQLIRAMNCAPISNPAFVRFVNRQCVLWAVSAVLLGALGAGLMISAEARLVAAWMLAPLALAPVLVFIGSHYYARWRYARPERWAGTLKAMTDPKIWAMLRL